MSSKSDNTGVLPKGMAAPQPGWSITRRLTLLYIASTAALLLISAGLLYWALIRSLDQSRRGMIANKVEVLRLLLREQPQKADVLASEVEHEASASYAFKYYVRLLDEKGRVRLETPGMAQLLDREDFPPPQGFTAQTLHTLQRVVAPKRPFLLMSVYAPSGPEGQTWMIQIALDASTRLALVASYRHKLLAALAVGLIFAAVTGAWVARTGMRPLNEIARTARQTTAAQMHERIVLSEWPAELAELGSQFNAMLDRLEDSFNRLSQFAADLAHELRTPFNNLRGEAEVALARSRTPEEYQHILASSLEEYQRLSRMLDELLFLARADDPKSAMQIVEFDARKEIDAVREFYEPLAAEHEVGVVCEGNARLQGDQMLFRRAVSNLLANALRHTPTGGSIQISLRSDRGETQLRVSDNGAGISAEHLPRIFERFYRADTDDARGSGGSGLGLAIVRSIMRLHGGTASIESRLGHGTTVILGFPARPPSAPR